MPLRVSELTIHLLNQHLYKVDICPLIVTSDIVGLGNPALVENKVDSACMILDIEPITNILALSLYRQRFTFAYILDE